MQITGKKHKSIIYTDMLYKQQYTSFLPLRYSIHYTSTSQGEGTLLEHMHENSVHRLVTSWSTGSTELVPPPLLTSRWRRPILWNVLILKILRFLKIFTTKMMGKVQNKESNNIRPSTNTFSEEGYSTCLATVPNFFDKHNVLSRKCVRNSF
jgi:hypothetical protein